MHTPFTLWMNFSHVQMTCIPDLYDRVNVHNILHCNISYMFVKSSPVTGLEWPRGFQEVKVPRFHDNGTGWW
jgi:hypothetical protein